MSFLGNSDLGDTLPLFRRISGLISTVATWIGGLSGPASNAEDPSCRHLAGLNKTPPLVRGVVVRSGLGSYDCEVEIRTNVTVVCSMLAPMVNDLTGVSQACMPVPGSSVLVYVERAGLQGITTGRGVILGVLPDNGVSGLSTKGESGAKSAEDLDYPEGGVTRDTESGPDAIARDVTYSGRDYYQNGRIRDLVPGEYALTSHAGAGVVIGALSTTIKGSELASVRCSALDDQVRITSGHFRHIHAAGSDEIFKDAGFITVESSVTMYAPERLGVKSWDASPFNCSPVPSAGSTARHSGIEPQVKAQTSKKRLYRYSGYLGDIVNVFVANPDPAKDTEDMLSSSNDQGLYHAHVDASGRMQVRSAGGIMLERYDRIPIPKRNRYAWDPAGDKDGGSGVKDKPGYKLDKEHPMSVGLILGDMAAWWNQQAYARFRQFDKDFTVPDQQHMTCPDDEYDKLGNGKEDFKEYDTRHSYISLTPNGGIVLRDAWGSEIIMADGRITFNAAANIEIRSGSSVVVLGGDDVVAKAYNSVDISATNKDVRIKADGNLQMVSMKRGVLVQSKAVSDGSPDWKKVGEDLESSGIVLKADKSTVTVTGMKASIQGTSQVGISSFDDKGKPSGEVVLAGARVSSVASDSIVSAVSDSNGTSGVYVSSANAFICGPSVLAVGGSDVSDVAGNRMMLGLPVDVGDLYGSTSYIFKDKARRYIKTLTWLNPYPPAVVSSIDFRFRNTEQYGTKENNGLSPGQFTVYEPSWAMMAEKRDWLKAFKPRGWTELPDSNDGYPWPGKDAMTGRCYVKFVEKNIIENGTEKPQNGEADLTQEGFSSYHIRTAK